MAINWFFTRDEMEFGPFTSAQLREQANGGHLRPQDLVWQSGMKKRVAASRVKDLFTSAEIPAPSPSSSAEYVAQSDVCPPPEVPPVPADDDDHPELFVPENAKLVPLGNEPPTPVPPPPEQAKQAPVPPANQPPARKWRVVRIKGGVIVSQDGAVLRFRKKCLTCAYEDRSVASLPLRGGVLRSTFFCPKCRKSQPVEAHADR